MAQVEAITTPLLTPATHTFEGIADPNLREQLLKAQKGIKAVQKPWPIRTTQDVEELDFLYASHLELGPLMSNVRWSRAILLWINTTRHGSPERTWRPAREGDNTYNMCIDPNGLLAFDAFCWIAKASGWGERGKIVKEAGLIALDTKAVLGQEPIARYILPEPTR